MLLVANFVGAVPGGPAGLVTALATTAGDLVIPDGSFAAVGAEATPFGAATGAFALLLRGVRHYRQIKENPETYSSSSLRRLPNVPIKPPSFSTIFTPSSIALMVLSVVLKGAAGAVAAEIGAAEIGAAEGIAFFAVVDGFAGTGLAAPGAPGVFAGILADGVTFAAEAGALGLGAGVEAAGFEATPGPDVEFVADLVTGLLTEAAPIKGLLVGVVEDVIVCFGGPFAGFGTEVDPEVAGLFAVTVAGAGTDGADFWVVGATFGVVLATDGLVATCVLFGTGTAVRVGAGAGAVGLTSAILTCNFENVQQNARDWKMIIFYV
jgi:hypothetical protein